MPGYKLGPGTPKVAFNFESGTPINFDLSKYTCKLNIRTNLYLKMDYALIQNGINGNFSSWVPINPGDAIAVTGLTSCGAVFFVNSMFTKVAAGHMSGDAQFVEEWCQKLVANGSDEPKYLLWGTGPDGSSRTGGQVLMQYMRRFNITPVLAPAVVKCGQIVLSRDRRVHATYAQIIQFDPFGRMNCR